MAEPFDQVASLKKAVEFAQYLAKDAEELMEAMNERDALVLRVDEGEDVDDATLQDANETVGEFMRRLRLAIYEFRKRAQRIGASADREVVPSAGSASHLAAAPTEVTASAGSRDVPEYVPAAQRGQEVVTYWLWYEGECVGTKRLPVGTGAVDVRNAALVDAVILCDRANGERPHERRNKIHAATVTVYDDRAVQEQARRELPFELRGLFPQELPFFELIFRSPLSGVSAAAHIADVTVGLQDVAFAEGLELSAKPRDTSERLVRVESGDREALGRADVAMKAYLVERDAELVSDFGVGYARIETPVDANPDLEMERPRG